MGKLLKNLSLRGDKVIWVIIFFLSMISLLVVYSSTGTLAYKVKGGNTSYFFIKQLILLGGCYMIMYVVHRIHFKVYSSSANLVLIVSIGLLILAKFVGTNLNDASRWITIPGIGFNFQPSELAKLALILHVSRTLSRFQSEDSCKKEAFLHIIIPVGIVCFLIFLDDFSTSVLLGGVCYLLMFIGRVAKKYLLGSVGVVLGLVIMLIVMAPLLPSIGRVQTVRSRIVNFFDKDETNVNNSQNYQVDQAKIAVASGGILGKGPGNSDQRNFLPHPYSDFIYAIILEELGWTGGFGILALYLFLIYRAGSIVRKCDRTFPAFLVIGLSLSIVAQALTNMAVSVNLIPVTGQPLPLVSMGGTSLIFTSAALGMILSVSRSVKEQEELKHAEN
ncbi:putative lipid II flippase FtsW [Labilibaculum sp. DW002]|uniref:Probable peptidoglycan glycosyltransferase FtsW n=1 Tax=Paralabilibaculum antarcticum TaxID=2912572 RepID=A0ABT5VXH1_9BACT|nr:putative peptidoglycan glycosyltransferase FtsW [Labilibaculum sp. DW002]MDE5420115.1 putative lipid II flippase FtsW [Labilibaculum sp. DW002]